MKSNRKVLAGIFDAIFLNFWMALALGFVVALAAHATAEDKSPSPAPQTVNAKKAPLPNPSGSQQDVKKGGIDDLSAIGNRNVGCAKGFGNWYSIEKQVQMGKQFAAQVEANVKLINDPVIAEYVNRVGQNLVRNSDAKVPFTIKVIDSDEVNAFALPGGFFYVNSGLILAADNEAELAGVMAHEIAHVAACHAARNATRGSLAQLATVPLIFVGGGIGYGAYQAAGFALPATFMKFSRNFEAQADHLGLEYMYKAGYDPQSFVAFFEKIQALEKKKPGFIAKAFANHPQTPDRIAKSEEEIQRILPAREQYEIDTSEFEDVKARLAAIENRRKPADADKANKPTLRRAKSVCDKKKDKNCKDDDRPTLEKRGDD